ncbi:3-ketoacyl-CoA thiolase [Streptomyces badius]
MPRTIRDVVFVDGVRTPFGKAGPKGIYHETRADDLVVKAIRELLRRNPDLDPKKIDEVAIAATTQIGDQGLTLGRTAGILAGLPKSVPGYSIDRMCAGALTAVTSTAGSIAFGAYDVVVAGGVEHMGRHPMGEGVDPNPRFVSEKLVDESALFMGMTAENLHDRYPTITKQRADEYAVRSQEKAAKAYANGKIQQDLVPVSVRRTNAEAGETGWGLVTADEPMRPGTTLESLANLKTPFRAHGRVTAGNAAGLNDGATASLLAAEDVARELGLPVKMRLVSYAFAGVEPEVMGYGPIPATEKALAQAGLTIDDIGLFEINETFAVQVRAFPERFTVSDERWPRSTSTAGAASTSTASGAPVLDPEVAALLKQGDTVLTEEQTRDRVRPDAVAQEIGLAHDLGGRRFAGGPVSIDLCLITGAGWPSTGRHHAARDLDPRRASDPTAACEHQADPSPQARGERSGVITRRYGRPGHHPSGCAGQPALRVRGRRRASGREPSRGAPLNGRAVARPSALAAQAARALTDCLIQFPSGTPCTRRVSRAGREWMALKIDTNSTV